MSADVDFSTTIRSSEEKITSGSIKRLAESFNTSMTRVKEYITVINVTKLIYTYSFSTQPSQYIGALFR